MHAHRKKTSSAFVALVTGLIALAAFFLVRPAFSSGGYYRARPAGTTNDYWWLILLAFVPYAAAIRSWRRGNTVSIRVLLVSAVVVFLAFVPAPAQQSQDMYQYLVYGRMANQGVSPYAHVAAGHDEWTDHVLWRGTPSAYGPLWTAASAAVARASGGSLTAAFLLLKALAAVLAIAAIFLLSRLRAADGVQTDGGLAVLALAFNPLVVVSVGLGAHADVAVAAAISAALWFSGKGRPFGVTVALTVAALVKAYAGLALLIWLVHVAKRRGFTKAASHAGGVVAISATAFAPYWTGVSTFEGISQVSRLASASLTGGLMRILSGRWNSGAGLTTVGTAIRFVAVAILVFALFRIARFCGERPFEAIASALAVYVILAPWFLPWHVLGLLVLAAALPGWRGTDPTLVFSATALVDLPGGVQTLVRYGPPLGMAVRDRRRISTGDVRRTAPSPRS